MSEEINYPNTVTDIAQEIISDMDNDSSLSISYISTWLRDNIGKLNNSIGASFKINELLEFTPCINNDEKDIFKWLFICQYYANQAKNNLGASMYDWSEIKEADSVVRRVSKNEIAKTYLQLSSQCKESLKQIILYYKTNRALPRSLSSYNSPMWKYDRVNDPHTPISYPFGPFYIP